jgi:putative ABC transport system permease protein
MESLLQDVRYGARMLIRRPAFTFIAALALALGIGASSAIFSVVNAVLLRPLPYRDPDRLVMLWHSYPKLNLPNAAVSAPSYIEYRDNTASFEQVVTATAWSPNLTGIDEPQRLQGARVSWNFFPTIEVEPIKGRNFLGRRHSDGHQHFERIFPDRRASGGAW